MSTTNKKKPSATGVSRGKAIELFRSMVLIRRSQEALINEYHPADEMRCPVHFCVGQEGPAAGVSLALNTEDYAFTGHRSHGFFLAKGGKLRELFSELYGKSTGTNRGKAGSMELCDETVNFYSGTILAGILPIAAGAALASQLRADGRVAIAGIGDGGADEGVVYETLNFAALKNLPMIFVCENNQFSVQSPQDTRQGLCDLTKRAQAFGVPARRIDGNDVMGVYKATRAAVTKARAGKGPTFLEMDTYRWCGHVGPENDDIFEYRSQKDLNDWMQRCPIDRAAAELYASGVLDELQVASIESEVANEITDAFKFAKLAPFPEASVITQDVFATEPSNSGPKTIFEAPVFDFRQSESTPRPY